MILKMSEVSFNAVYYACSLVISKMSEAAVCEQFSDE